MIDTLKSTLLNGYFANGTLLTGLRWPTTFLVGMGLKYSCKSILDKSHRCALAPLLNNEFGSIFFSFFFFYNALSRARLSLPPVNRSALTTDRREARSSPAVFTALSLKLGPGVFLTFAVPFPTNITLRRISLCFI